MKAVRIVYINVLYCSHFQMKFDTFHVVCTFTSDENNRVVLPEKRSTWKKYEKRKCMAKQCTGMEGRGELILVDITSSRLHYQPPPNLTTWKYNTTQQCEIYRTQQCEKYGTQQCAATTQWSQPPLPQNRQLPLCLSLVSTHFTIQNCHSEIWIRWQFRVCRKSKEKNIISIT